MRHTETEPDITPADLDRALACPEPEVARLHQVLDDLHLRLAQATHESDEDKAALARAEAYAASLQARLQRAEQERDSWHRQADKAMARLDQVLDENCHASGRGGYPT